MEMIQGPGLPAPIGPYSPAARHGEWLFVSGQIAPEAGGLGQDSIKRQTSRALERIQVLLEAAGLSLGDVLKTTVYMTDLDLFAAMNEAYAGYFKPPYPARSTVGVSALPKGAGVEIEAVAYKKDGK